MVLSEMDPEQSVPALLSKNEQLEQENDQLKMTLTVLKENIDMKTKMQGLNINAVEESKGTVGDSLCKWMEACSPPGKKTSCLMQTTYDERQFSKDFQQTRFKQEHRTSSPIDFMSFIQKSILTDSKEKVDSQNCQADVPLELKDRVLGEIAYQLDRRILSYIFQGQKRLYGFTMLNIPEKILEVSTHPLTGKVDEGYQLYLGQRYTEIIEQLNQLGFKTKLHPLFSEFIVNSYGILKDRPSESTAAINYNNPDTLRKLIMTTAPVELQKNLLLMLICLCNMAEKDRKPLLLW